MGEEDALVVASLTSSATPKSHFWIPPDAKLKKIFLADRIQIYATPALVRKHLTRTR